MNLTHRRNQTLLDAPADAADGEERVSVARASSARKAPAGAPGASPALGYDENRFLERAEAMRLQRQCPIALDMRQHLSAPCTRSRYRGRTFWLDERSRQLFLEGIERDSGIFTVATYEAIMAGVGQNRSVPDSSDSLPDRLRAIRAAIAPPSVPVSEILELGYFERRQDLRIKYSARVFFVVGGNVLPGHTRDISYTGLKVRTTLRVSCQIGDVLQVKLPKLPGVGDLAGEYRVTGVSQNVHEVLISLHCEEQAPHPLLDGLRRFIDQQREVGGPQLRVDSKDASLTSSALLAERYYMRSTALIPIFLASEGRDAIQLKVVSTNDRNRDSIAVFGNESAGYDLSPLTEPKRLKRLLKLAKVDGHVGAMLAVLRTADGHLESLADFECEKDAQWYKYLLEHQGDRYLRVFQFVVRAVRRPDPRRIQRELDALRSDLGDDAQALMGDIAAVSAVGALVDMTAEVRTWNLAPYATAPIGRRTVAGAERKSTSPELLPVTYVEQQRADDRFLVPLKVSLQANGRVFDTETRDVSLAGLCVCLPEDAPNVSIGDTVNVTFAGLADHATVIGRLRKVLADVPYEVVGRGAYGSRPLRLHLRDPERQSALLKELSGFLAKKRSKLNIDRSHVVQATASRLYSSLFVETSPTLSVLYFRSAVDAIPSAKLGLTQHPNALAAFFETADRRFDFSAITAREYRSRVWADILKHGHSETILYLIKERVPGEARFVIRSVEDSELGDRLQRREFLDYVIDRDFRIVKIVAGQASIPPAMELELVLDRLDGYSSRQAERLRAEYETLVAVGDIVDITGHIYELQYFV